MDEAVQVALKTGSISYAMGIPITKKQVNTIKLNDYRRIFFTGE